MTDNSSPSITANKHNQHDCDDDDIDVDDNNNKQSNYIVHVNLLRSLHGAFMYNPLATTMSSDADGYNENQHFYDHHHHSEGSNNTKSL